MAVWDDNIIRYSLPSQRIWSRLHHSYATAMVLYCFHLPKIWNQYSWYTYGPYRKSWRDNNSNFGWSRAAFTTLLSSRCGSAATSIILFWLDYTGPLPKDTNSSFPILSPKHFPESILTAKPVFPWHWTHLLLDLNWKSGLGEGREERASLVNHAQLFALFYFNALQIWADDT